MLCLAEQSAYELKTSSLPLSLDDHHTKTSCAHFPGVSLIHRGLLKDRLLKNYHSSRTASMLSLDLIGNFRLVELENEEVW